MRSTENDLWLKMAKEQGYIPVGCTLKGQLVMLLVGKGEDPCAGCNNDRAECGGRPRQPQSRS